MISGILSFSPMPCLPVKCLYSTTNQKQKNKQTIQANNKQSKKKKQKQKQANKQILIIIIIICLLDKHIQLAISSYIDNINRKQSKQTNRLITNIQSKRSRKHFLKMHS